MALFENEKLSKVNERIEELSERKEALQSEIDQILEAVKSSVEDYALGEVEEDDVNKAKNLLEEKTKEIEELDGTIQRVKNVKRTVAAESIPFVKEARQKKFDALQKRYDSQAEKVMKARDNFLRELAALGQTKNEGDKINDEYNRNVEALGEKGDWYGKAIKEARILPAFGYYQNETSHAIHEQTQRQAYATGRLPNGFGNNEK